MLHLILVILGDTAVIATGVTMAVMAFTTRGGDR